MEWEKIPKKTQTNLINLLGQMALKKLKMGAKQGAAINDDHTQKLPIKFVGQREDSRSPSRSSCDRLHQTINIAAGGTPW
jgi:hypothetical protein